MQVAGFFVQSIPDWIGWLKYLSFIYYGYNTLLKVSLPGHSMAICMTVGTLLESGRMKLHYSS